MDGTLVLGIAAIMAVVHYHGSRIRRRQKRILTRLRNLQLSQPTLPEIRSAIEGLQISVYVEEHRECEMCGAEGTTCFAKGENRVWLCETCLQEQADYPEWE